MNLWVHLIDSQTGAVIDNATFGGPTGLAWSHWPNTAGLYVLQNLNYWQSFWATAPKFYQGYFNTDNNIVPDGSGQMWISLTPLPCGWPNCPP